MEHKTLQLGTLAVALALILRLAGAGEAGLQEVGSTLLFLSSGRLVTPQVSAPLPIETTQATEPKTIPVFGQDQAELVQVETAWAVDTLSLLRAPLQWDLRSGKPTVLILHTHGTESYEKKDAYTESSPYRTLDTGYNMVGVGDRVAEILEEGGIQVIHDRTLHDHPSYNDAYSHARSSIQKILEENPSICMVLDLHRDAVADESGKQKAQTAKLQGVEAARLMLVMGSDKGGLSYPQWESNLALAVKLQAQLEGENPGLCRPIHLVKSRYNQDLCTGAVLIEIGAAGNTLEQALYSAELLAQGILALADGANV